jgi:hypothetical protein
MTFSLGRRRGSSALSVDGGKVVSSTPLGQTTLDLIPKATKKAGAQVF